MNEIRTYLSFTTPVDPAKLQTIPDMDMSYALASTLVEWSPDKEISAALANKWIEVSPHVYRFTLRNTAKWSDGKPVTSRDVVRGLERGFKTHPIDLRSLEQMIEKMDCPNDHEIDFKLKENIRLDSLLGKLTEPNYGVIKTDDDDNINLSISTGPFFLSRLSTDELVLSQNSHWYGKQNGMAERVIVRKPPVSMDSATVLMKDHWPNLIETSSLINEQILGQYKSEKFGVRQRPLDKFFHLQLSKRSANQHGRQLLAFLRSKAKLSSFTSGLSGYSQTTQIFPKGYQLYDSAFTCPVDAKAQLPEEFKKRPVEIMIANGRVSEGLRNNIEKAIKDATGIAPKFTMVALENLRSKKLASEYDLYAGTVGLADPDPEGAMSFYLEGDAPIIPSTGNNFLARLDEARKQTNSEAKLSKMRSILRDAVCENFVFPLFHTSTIGIARQELDLSQIPQSDESVTLSKVRFFGVK